MKPVLLQCKEWLAKNALLYYAGLSRGPCCILTTTKCRSDARKQLHKKLRHYSRQNGIFWVACNFSMRLAIQRKKLFFSIAFWLNCYCWPWIMQSIEWLKSVCCVIAISFGVSWILLLFLVLSFSLHLTFVTWRKQTYFSGFAQY